MLVVSELSRQGSMGLWDSVASQCSLLGEFQVSENPVLRGGEGTAPEN